MSAILDKFYDAAESVLPMEGTMAPLWRAAIGGVLGYLVIAAIRPSFAYNDVDGSPRPWAVMPEMFPGRGAPTHLPFIVGPLLGVLLFAGFI